jgi:predicted nucleic acid-binding protein
MVRQRAGHKVWQGHQRILIDEYELLLTSFPNLLLAPVTRNVLSLAATLRARYGLRTPDAIVLATGIRNGATLAVTKDVQWQRASAEISVHLLSEA